MGKFVLYSTQFYSNHHELGYGVDGVDGRIGLNLHGPNLPPPLHRTTFDRAEQERLLIHLVSLLFRTFDLRTGSCALAVTINAGDIIVRPYGPDDYDMKLVTVRIIYRGKEGSDDFRAASFIKSLLQVHVHKSPYAIFLLRQEHVQIGIASALRMKGMTIKGAEGRATQWMDAYRRLGAAGELNHVLSVFPPHIRATLTHDQVMDAADIIRTQTQDRIREAFDKVAKPLT